MYYIGSIQSSGVVTFSGSSNTTLCHLFTPVDNSLVGNDVNLLIRLVSDDRAVATIEEPATIIIRDDDSKWLDQIGSRSVWSHEFTLQEFPYPLHQLMALS